MTEVLLAGANPCVTLSDDGTPIAFASVWVVDWSIHGSGNAIVLWHNGSVRVLATDATLGRWLERYFVRHFPETDGLAWPEPEVEVTEVAVDIDMAAGVIARAADVEIDMTGVLHRRMFTTDDFKLDGVPHGLTLLLAPLRAAEIRVGGSPLPGAVTQGGEPDRPSSSAFATIAEVWTLPG
ncbi:hypothetical protein [Actinokineospora sp. HUAS TT18]|uniref:hypothetical protein n=1 Tax=Actinokineospora sp. HUAS TT18 TaxID=3447451 RepID=UPI003F521EEC